MWGLRPLRHWIWWCRCSWASAPWASWSAPAEARWLRSSWEKESGKRPMNTFPCWSISWSARESRWLSRRLFLCGPLRMPSGQQTIWSSIVWCTEGSCACPLPASCCRSRSRAFLLWRKNQSWAWRCLSFPVSQMWSWTTCSLWYSGGGLREQGPLRP